MIEAFVTVRVKAPSKRLVAVQVKLEALVQA
jgi:hypothetical protein